MPAPGGLGPLRKRNRGETESDEGPGDLRPVERADHGRSALDLQAEQESVAKQGEAQGRSEENGESKKL